MERGIEERLLIIRRNDFFALLTEEEYENLNIVHNFIVAEKNDYVYFDAQCYDKLYFIKEGHVKIGNINDEGHEIITDVLQPGDVFGQFTLERDNMQGEFAQAGKAGVSLCAFTIEDFRTLLERRAALSIEFSKMVGKTLRRTGNRLINLLQKDVRTRVLYFFWTLSQQNPSDENHLFIENYLTHEDIARLTGSSRQTITTLMNQFAVEGILEMDRKTIRIPDVQLLKKLARVG
jgi:CRP/FNR family cyclic AMP-dependent transcriptional regulator